MKSRAILVVLVVLFSGCQNNKNRFRTISEIKKVSKIATTEVVVSKLILAEKSLNLFIVKDFQTSSLVVESKAFIKLGINLDKLKRKNVVIDGDMIDITLPPIEVISFSYPAESFKKLEEWSVDKIFTRISIQDQEEIFRTAELEIRGTLQELGVVEEAEKKTIQSLRILLSNLGYSEIYIDIERKKNLFS